MRRSKSSSCLLLPKEELDTADCSSPSMMSVTILSKDKLESYSSERFYLLSELQLHAHSCTFLGDLLAAGSPESDSASTEQTEELSYEETEYSKEEAEIEKNTANSQIGDHDNIKNTPKFAEFILLYVLWRPEQTSDPNEFTETCLVPIMESLKEHVVPVSSIPQSSIRRASSTGGVDTTPRPVQERQRTNPTAVTNRKERTNASVSNNSSEKRIAADGATINQQQQESALPKASVYLVVDRVFLKSDGSASNHSTQEDLAEHLARVVSSHPVLRFCLEGITVAVSNHERAAPGLDACVQAILVGAQDRRRHAGRSNNLEQKSLLGMVANTSDELLGLQSQHVTDAAQDVLQSKITAEWNGQGNLETFAARAHNCWSCRCGIELPSSNMSPRRRPIRRTREAIVYSRDYTLNKGNRMQNQAAKDRAWRETMYDIVAFCFIAGYILFHFGRQWNEYLNCWAEQFLLDEEF